MFRSAWLHNLFRLGHSRKDRRRQPARPCSGVRLMLEALEDRLTPSTVTESAADAATLQTDLNNATAANTQYIINLTGASSAYNLSAGQELTVSAAASGSNVTILGTGQSITGNGNRVFSIDSGANVALQNLTIKGGTVTETSGGFACGGGIYDTGGNVALSKVTVEDNKVTGSWADGGGIYMSGGGNLEIKGGSVIQSNRAGGNVFASGGGVYVFGASKVAISDSTICNNSAEGIQGGNGTSAGAQGGAGGGAFGGGLCVLGPNWTVTMTGDMLSGNTVIGGNGGNGAAGSNATGTNAAGGIGGGGGVGGTAKGGAAFFDAGSGTSSLTILNDLNAPTTDPSMMIDNSVQAGAGGNGGAGGSSTGTADNADGGAGGVSSTAAGGALFINAGSSATLTITIGNSAFYGNKVFGCNGGTGGAAGTGGSGTAGAAGGYGADGAAGGGGVDLRLGNATMVNNTVANNTVTAASGNNGGIAIGGGIRDTDTATVVLDNNTITQNTLNGLHNAGSGVYTNGVNPTLLNNLIQGNQSIDSSAFDLGTAGATLSNATNNFIGTSNANAVSTATNIVGNSQPQLGGAVGVTASGQPSGGPIYYPLSSGTTSVGYGTTSVLSTIAAVEGTTTANAEDEIGNLLSDNGASIDIGAVQSALSPPPSPPSPPPSPPSPPPSPPSPPPSPPSPPPSPPSPPPSYSPPSYSSPPSPLPSPPQSSPQQPSSPFQTIDGQLENLLSSLEVEINLLLEIIETDL